MNDRYTARRDYFEAGSVYDRKGNWMINCLTYGEAVRIAEVLNQFIPGATA
jgi:hypothetical protein